MRDMEELYQFNVFSYSYYLA